MTQRVDVSSSGGLLLKNQLVTNPAMRSRVWQEASAGRKVTITPAAPPKPPPKPPVQSVFAGKGAFTTSSVGSCAGLDAAWTAIQKDSEGDHTEAVVGRLCFWQARPTQLVVDEARERGIPFIGQAENPAEFSRCVGLDTVGLTKALVGNAGDWGPNGQKVALEQGWDYITEWYWNAHPWEQGPDGHQYPRFVNACFGIYSEGEPGGEGYVPQSKSVADYRRVWGGSFSVWEAEAMTPADRAAFNAA